MKAPLLFLLITLSFPYVSLTNAPANQYITEKEVIKRQIQLRHANHPYMNTEARVRISTELCDDECAYLEKRLPQVKESLEQILNMSIDDAHVPRIAICGSGGGCRAMIATLGSLRQRNKKSIGKRGFWNDVAHMVLHIYNYITGNDYENNQALLNPIDFDLGLLDACTYTAGVSGSSWAFNGLIQSRMTVNNYLKSLKQTLNHGLVSDFSMHNLVGHLMKKYSYNQSISLIDIYGALLGEKLLSNAGYDDTNDIGIDLQRHLVDTGSVPLPISSAIIGNPDMQDYEWVEFTPYEIGSPYLNAYIPTWAFGRVFNQGYSQDFAPPQSLGYCMGIWGSAMSINAQEFFEHVIKPQIDQVAEKYLENNFGPFVVAGASILESILKDISTQFAHFPVASFLEQRLSPARVPNWSYNLFGSKLSKEKELILIDANIDYPISCPPILEKGRTIDIIILLDNSETEPGKSLREAEKYAQERNLKFPLIDYTKVNALCSVHEDNDPETPLVIYLPLLNNPNYNNNWDPWCESFVDVTNFTYMPKEIDQLSGLSYFTMQQNKEIVITAIRKWIEQKQEASTPA